MNDFLKKLLAGTPSDVYDYSKSPEENQMAGAALSSDKIAKDEKMNNAIDLIESPRDPARMQALDFMNQPEVIRADAIPKPANIKPSLPLAYKDKPLVLPQEEAAPEAAAPNLQELLSQVSQKKTQTDPSLIQAQQDRDDMLRSALWLKAGNTFGHAMAGGVPTDPNLLDDFKALAGNKVANILQQRAAGKEDEQLDMQRRNQVISETKAGYDIQTAAMQANDAKAQTDPNSEISKGVREYIGKLGVSIGDNVPYSQVAKLVPEFTSKYQTDLNRQAHLEGLKMKYTELADAREARSGAKSTADTEKKFASLAKDVDYRDKSSRSPGGKIMLALDTSERLSGLIGKDPSKMSSQEMRELVTGVNSLIGGSQAVSQIEHMDYNTLKRTYSEMLTKITGNPQPMNSPEVVNRVKGLVDREHKILQGQLKKDMDIKLKKYPELQNDDRVKDLYSEILGNHDDSSSSGEDPRIQSFMQKNGIKDKQEAIKILKDNGKL